MDLGALAGGLGCFPLDHEPYRPRSDSQDLNLRHSEFEGFGKRP